MKLIKVLLASVIAYSSLSFADNQPVNVRIITDSDFKDYNILFLADGPSRQEIGFHEAGGSLVSFKEVKPVSSKDKTMPVHITAYMTKAATNQTIEFVSRESFDFAEGDQIGLSFPNMFKQK